MDQRPYLHEAKLRGVIATKGWHALAKMAFRKILIAMFAFLVIFSVAYHQDLKQNGLLGSLYGLMAFLFMGLLSGLASMIQTRTLVFEKDKIIVSGYGQGEKTMTYSNITQCMSIDINDNLEKWKFTSTEKPSIEFFVTKKHRSRKRCIEHLLQNGVKWAPLGNSNHSLPIET